jgi:hypothetical protein
VEEGDAAAAGRVVNNDIEGRLDGRNQGRLGMTECGAEEEGKYSVLPFAFVRSALLQHARDCKTSLPYHVLKAGVPRDLLEML